MVSQRGLPEQTTARTDALTNAHLIPGLHIYSAFLGFKCAKPAKGDKSYPGPSRSQIVSLVDGPADDEPHCLQRDFSKRPRLRTVFNLEGTGIV
jgi:hypothetical protein